MPNIISICVTMCKKSIPSCCLSVCVWGVSKKSVMSFWLAKLKTIDRAQIKLLELLEITRKELQSYELLIS